MTTTTYIAAEYWGIKKQPIVDIVLIANGERTYLHARLPVAGKREARKLAAAHNAVPWNF